MKDKFVIVNQDRNGLDSHGKVNIDHPELFKDKPDNVKPDFVMPYLDYLVEQYYNHDHAVIPDKEFDAYAKALGKQYEMEQSSRNSLAKVQHTFNASSLAKAHTINGDIANWMNAMDTVADKLHEPALYDVEWKADGITVVVYINTFDNPLVIATRGGGYEGEDITHNASLSEEIQNLLPNMSIFNGKKIIIRAEAVIYEDDFQKYGQKYVDKRAMVSGVARNTDDSLAHLLHLRAHQVIGLDLLTGQALLSKLGFPNLVIQSELKSDEVLDVMNGISKDDSRNQEMDTDGLVVKSLSEKLHKAVGETDKYPNWAIAYKYDNDSSIGVVDNVEWQLGKTGKYSPVIHLKEPVVFGARSINRISGGSYRLIKDYQVVPDAQIIVELANEVIPKITGNFNPSDEEPEIEIPDDAYIDGAHLYKKNFVASELDRSEEIFSLIGMKNFKGSKLRKLIDAGLLKENSTPLIVQAIDIKPEDISSLPGLGMSTAYNFTNTVAKSQESLWYGTILVMLGVKGLSWKAAEAIANATRDNTIDELPNKFSKFLPAVEDKQGYIDQIKAVYNVVF